MVSLPSIEVKPYWKVALSYFGFGMLWIAITDAVVAYSVDEPAQILILQTFKGWIYVIISSVMVYFLTRIFYDRAQEAERKRAAVFEKTMRATHHIFLNYLNQMQLVVEEARDCEGFDRKTLELAEEISSEASRDLISLGNEGAGGVENQKHLQGR